MIPKENEIRIPILKELSDGRVVHRDDLELPLAECFQLTEEELLERHESGSTRKFANHIAFALSDLFRAGLLTKPKRGWYSISDQGRSMLASRSAEEIEIFVKEKLKELKQQKSDSEEEEEPADSAPIFTVKHTKPYTELMDSYAKLRAEIKAEILDQIRASSPESFAKLGLELLQKMGYGGQHSTEPICHPVKGNSDQIIQEDILGLRSIYVRARAYAKNHNVEFAEVQSFAGATIASSASRGVFLTTSDYAKVAKEYVKSLNAAPKIVLINGEQLAEYIYDYGVGLKVQDSLQIMQLDKGYWDKMN